MPTSDIDLLVGFTALLVNEVLPSCWNWQALVPKKVKPPGMRRCEVPSPEPAENTRCTRPLAAAEETSAHGDDLETSNSSPSEQLAEAGKGPPSVGELLRERCSSLPQRHSLLALGKCLIENAWTVVGLPGWAWRPSCPLCPVRPFIGLFSNPEPTSHRRTTGCSGLARIISVDLNNRCKSPRRRVSRQEVNSCCTYKVVRNQYLHLAYKCIKASSMS